MQVKLKKYYLIFLVLYLIALILLGANRMGPYPTSGGFPQNAVLKKAAVFIWGLMPSQTIGWWAISLVVLVILIVLVFVAGCVLILYVQREEPAEGEVNIRLRLRCKVIGFFVGAIVAMGFTVLGLKIDIKIISMYDYNPWGISFMLILLIVGLLVGWKVETITTRRLLARARAQVKERYGVKWDSKIVSDNDDPVWVTNLAREFYDFEDFETKKWDNYDLMLPNYGEVLSGSKREYEYDKLVEKMERDGVGIENYKVLLKLAKEGRIKPSAGAGIGIERLISWIVGARHIGEIQPFPRIPGVVYEL